MGEGWDRFSIRELLFLHFWIQVEKGSTVALQVLAKKLFHEVAGRIDDEDSLLKCRVVGRVFPREASAQQTGIAEIHMPGTGHGDVVSIRFAARILTRTGCRTGSVYLSRDEKKRLVQFHRPYIVVHAGKGRAVEIDAGKNAALLKSCNGGGRTPHGVADDGNLGEIQAAAPEGIVSV